MYVVDTPRGARPFDVVSVAQRIIELDEPKNGS